MDDLYSQYLKIFTKFEDKVKNMDSTIFNDINIINTCLEKDNIIYIDTILKLYSKVYITTIYHSSNEQLNDFFEKCLDHINISYIKQVKLNVKLNAAHHENYINQIKQSNDISNKLSYIEEFLNFDLNKAQNEEQIKLYVEAGIQFALEMQNDELVEKIVEKVCII